MILTNTKLILQDTYSEEIVHEILKVFGLVAPAYPFVFASHFQDVVDLLLGWATDSETTPSLANSIYTSFLEFRPFWLQNTAFGMELLKQFLDDLAQSIEDKTFPLGKGTSLLNCFHSIVNPICGGLSPVQGTETVTTRLLQLLAAGQGRAQSLAWNSIGNNLLVTMIPNFPGMNSSHSVLIVAFLLGQFSPFLTSEELSSSLSALSLLLATPRIPLSTQALRNLLNPFSTFLSLRLHSSEAVLGKVRQVLRDVL